MEYNQGLLERFERQFGRDASVHLYHFIWNKWPQINPKSRIELVSTPEVYVALMHPVEPRKIWANRPGRKARIWRALGELLSKRSLIRKGQEYGPDPFAAPITHETIRLERLGYTNQMGQTQSVMLGYFPAQDIVYLLSREWRGLN